MIRCDNCAQCRHGRPSDGWPYEEHTWVAECGDYREAVFVQRKARDETEGMGTTEVESKVTRMFNLSDQGRALESGDKIVAYGDGGLLIRDIIVLAEGTWTDSLVRTPLHYTAKALSKDASNWVATGIWSRHTGGAPRAINDKIGEIKNPRFSLEHKAVLADGFLHGRTQSSRDVIELVKAGLVTDVSAEVGGREVWNADAKRYEAASLAFYGLAIVDKGACDVCKLKHNEAGEPANECQDETKGGETTMSAEPTKEPTELEKKLADLESEKAGFVTELAALKEKLQADEKALSEKIATLEKALAEKDARVKELEKTPAPPKTVSGDSLGKDEGRELATPTLRVRGRNGEWTRA